MICVAWMNKCDDMKVWFVILSNMIVSQICNMFEKNGNPVIAVDILISGDLRCYATYKSCKSDNDDGTKALHNNL